MSLLAPFDRPLALPRLEVAAQPRAAPPSVPPLARVPERLEPRPRGRRTRSEVARFLTHVLLSDVSAVKEVVPELEASVDERVVVWSPSLFTTSRSDLVWALLDSDDAITDVTVSIVGESASRTDVVVEWHVTGRFNNAGFVNDDLLIEPSGGEVESTGVLVIVFSDGRVSGIRCYYDVLGLLEQIVRPVEGR